ncbi:hypothetical protein C7460_106147 [Marinoscillum furvescens DSM 4134]|uniref:Uncharacterized protein n=2 Tax=Marinoscillum furvescens TaxID=1026 RepID=A0A3D9L467_MARFU|nr:hypothetical protein C7460_106147 [Marinoscillum furvescens DSM 4134]
MIYYNPTDNDVLTQWIRYNPRTAFIMTQLGGKRSEELTQILAEIAQILTSRNIDSKDANSLITGRDFHTKIWKLALSVPLGIAVVSETMEQTTIANIYYEIGLMNALGKETLVVKTKGFKVPSDFVRTEYIKHSPNFQTALENFLNQTFEQAEYYGIMAENLDAKPLLSIDYLRRAYLITGDSSYRKKAVELLDIHEFDEHNLLMIRNYFDIK